MLVTANAIRLEKLFDTAIHAPEKTNLYTEQLRELHFDPSWKYCVSLISFHDKEGVAGLTLKTINNHILKLIETGNDSAFSYLASDWIVLIIANQSANETKKEINTFLSSFQGIWFDFSIGRAIRSINSLARSFASAERILQLKKDGTLPDTISSYNELGLYRVITGLEKDGILELIHEEYLEPLLSYDRVRGTEYVPFLYTYLRYEGRVHEIAELMYIHKNTVLYKIRKIEEILDCDLSTLEDRIFLTIACMNYQVCGKK